ncbi:FecR family protein [Pseudobacter ginsenosidimutans]|jgi:ferric-dicitrate binding protein FerR (iron transport regulator)|uniref:FecR family protein n=1 Tax=Pseudobacter ginsenosidimutans TaxID=661488 RepID=A0A4Q7N4X5_9BACT|nr:FecR family protein [Pseudobacter ginsenosidimutans]QEC44605.1 DUF4974 domain-containing protein [Pseudobacter ginsenosidimutans]RZS76084.1 FecR family protein [Pseudobacter ginsenosidimutans]
MEKERLLYLIGRVYDHQLSPEERNELVLALEDQNDTELVQLYTELMMEHPADINITYNDSHLQELINQITEVDHPSGDLIQLPSTRRYFLRHWHWAAASILLVLCIGAYLFFNTHSKTTQPAGIAQIQPGRDGAILTLHDGTRVLLDTIQNGVVALQGGAMAKVENGKLLYEANGHEAVINTMSTPAGRQFRLTLPDGTEVWLNSASSISYPTVFTGTERRVVITGEAYFEVAKNMKMPFRVNVNQRALVEVLGTKFNVNGYDNEPRINTTLLEGSVQVVSGRSVLLKPGQMAQVQTTQLSGTEIKIVGHANIEKIMAWKNGLFDFDNMDFDEAMRQLERWYNIEVVYENGIPKNIELYGKITKGVTLDGLLSVLKDIGVKCRLENRKLLIQQ